METVNCNFNNSNFTLNDVIELNIPNGSALKFIPSNFGTFFPNLESLSIRFASLKNLTADDLSQFPHLEYFQADECQVNVLPSNLFEGNPNMTRLIVDGPNEFDRNNSLHTVGQDLLLNTPKLQFVSLFKNFCINDVASSRSQVITMNSILHNLCAGGMEQTTTTQRTSSTTSGQANLWTQGGSKLMQLGIAIVSICLPYRAFIR